MAICWNCKSPLKVDEGNGELCGSCFVLRAARKEPLTRIEVLTKTLSKSLIKYVGELATPMLRERIKANFLDQINQWDDIDKDRIIEVNVAQDCSSVNINIKPYPTAMSVIPVLVRQ